MRCRLCGGNAGNLIDGAHALCAARAAHGLATPNLGERCPACGGRGTRGRCGVVLDLALGPAAIARSVAAQFPPCPACDGKGYVAADGVTQLALLALLDHNDTPRGSRRPSCPGCGDPLPAPDAPGHAEAFAGHAAACGDLREAALARATCAHARTEPGVDEDGRLAEPAYDVCVDCGARFN